jgi:putative sugar O-methyltransferase
MPIEKHTLTVQLAPERARLIARSLEVALSREADASRALSPYWQHHRQAAAFSLIDAERGLAQLRGESGFYFPGRSYSELEWVNTIDRLLWLGVHRQEMPWRKSDAARRALALSLPRLTLAGERLGYPWFGRRLSYDYLRALYHLHSIAPFVLDDNNRGRQRLVALEIGPGTGLLALALRQLVPNSTIVLVDLPEILPFSCVLLSLAFPLARFYMLGENEGRLVDPERYDFICLTPSTAADLPSESIDLAVNTDSMQEMEAEAIGAYFGLLRRVLRPPRLFYSSNRIEKWIGGRATRLADYPYEPRDRHLFSRLNAFMQTRWVWRKIRYRIPYPRREGRRAGERVIHQLTELAVNAS